MMRSEERLCKTSLAAYITDTMENNCKQRPLDVINKKKIAGFALNTIIHKNIVNIFSARN